MSILSSLQPVSIPAEDEALRALVPQGVPLLRVGNKADQRLPAAASGGVAVPEPSADVWISALTGEGLDALRGEFPALLPEGPPYFPEGVTTDQTDEEMAVQGGLTVSHESGLYAGTWGSNLAGWGTFGGPNIELDLFAGYKFEPTPGLSVDAGVTWYT